MGKLEHGVRVRTRNTKITRAILTTLAVVVAGALNPSGLVRGVLRDLQKQKGKKEPARNSIYIARGRLLKRGFIEYRDGLFSITERGRRFFEVSGGTFKKLTKSRRWDKKWRILIFDIREKQRGLREKVRRTLVALGFKRLQDSVWVYPYDCEDFIVLLKADFRIGKDLLYIIADTIENDGFLRKEFDLE